MPRFDLIPHPYTPCEPVRRLEAQACWTGGEILNLSYVVEGDISRLSIPGPRPPRRSDGLWRHTCFEAFLAEPGRSGYHEFNFAPSGEWAAYRFEDYRRGSSEVEAGADPRIALRRYPDRLELNARLSLAELMPSRESSLLRLALSAVLETEGGALAYWALRHPPGEPDFHHAQGFAFSLEPPLS
jgi:hypothetical protein